ncbi:hypothetical protein LguiA_026274 [Lonicera macranthoides]
MSILNKPFLTTFNLEVFEITRSSVQVNLPSNNNLPTASRDSFVGALDWTLSGTCIADFNSSICGAYARCYMVRQKIDTLNISKQKVIIRLRFLKQPVTLLDEDDEARLDGEAPPALPSPEAKGPLLPQSILVFLSVKKVLDGDTLVRNSGPLRFSAKDCRNGIFRVPNVYSMNLDYGSDEDDDDDGGGGYGIGLVHSSSTATCRG